MPASKRNGSHKRGILHALLPGATVDKNTKKIIVRVSNSKETITFNVGGTVFETYKSTLRTIPKSPLANDEFLARHFRPEKNDHFFDRDPEIFHCVLNYLRTGELHLPTSVCGPVVKSELEYWGLDDADIEECCWSRYSSWSTTLKALRKLEDHRNEGEQTTYYERDENLTTFRKFCRQVWLFMSDPTSSRSAQYYAYFSILIIMVSIFSFCAQTHEAFQVRESFRVVNSTVHTPDTFVATMYQPSTLTNTSVTADYSELHSPRDGDFQQYITVTDDVAHPILHFVDVACVVYFIMELSLRFIVSPRKCQFIILPMTIVEFLALLPDVVSIVARMISSTYIDYRWVMHFVDFLKVFRVCRIFRLMKHIPGLWILFYTLKASVWDLLLLLLFMFIGMLVASSLIYFAENRAQKDTFSSIPKCFWWAVITMTTVGYGDMFPTTNWGYFIGTATSISGVLIIGFTVPVLVNNFVMYYNHTRSTIRREEKRDSSFNGFSNLHTLDSMKCIPGFANVGLGDRIMELGYGGSKEDPKDSSDNERGSGIVFSVSRSGSKKKLESTPSNSTDDDQDEECKEMVSL